MRKLIRVKNILYFLLLLSGAVHAQLTLQGYVLDEEEKKPLEGAYVYIDGTTYSASTDAKGYFRISTMQKYNAPLVISYMGFETLRIDNPFQYEGKPVKMYLRLDATELDEVVITNKSPFTRKQMLTAFRKRFLGESKAGRSCKIENEDDIYLYYDESTNTLKAKCRTPIRVTNKRLQYKVMFDLAGFEVHYSTLSLSDDYVHSDFYAGTTSFTDLSSGGAADKKRKASYAGSIAHFLSTLRDNDWQNQKFTLYVNKAPVDPNDFFRLSDTLGYKKVELKKEAVDAVAPKVTGLRTGQLPPPYKMFDFIILRNMDTRTQSALRFETDTFYIDSNGLFVPITAFICKGYMGSLKVGDLLPVDYKYVP